MAAILAPSPHHPLVGDRRPDLRLVPGGARPDLAPTYRRRRVVAGLLAVLVVAGLLSGSRALLAPLAEPASAGPVAPASATAGSGSVVVRPGDTLWTIARRAQPRGDIRPLVDQLVAAHGSSSLRPGDTIAVPGSRAVERTPASRRHHRAGSHSVRGCAVRPVATQTTAWSTPARPRTARRSAAGVSA